jgi:MraZ protein
MSSSFPALKGRKDYKMDPKNRVAVPPEWRPASGEQLHLLLSDSYKLPVVKVLTDAEYSQRVADVENHGGLNQAQKRKLLGRLALNCVEATVNPQGKLLVPREWSLAANLEADMPVVLAGRGTYFEIWNVENFNQMAALEAAETDELNVDLDIF